MRCAPYAFELLVISLFFGNFGGFFLLFGSGFLGSGNSLFFLNGFFSLHSFLIFGHCFFFLKAPETSANHREQSADSRLKIRYKRAKKRP